MRRLLLRLRGQVPAGLDADDGRRAVARRAGARLRARRARLPGRHREGAAPRRRPVQRLRPRDLGGPHQPQHDAPPARDGARLVHRAARSSSRPPGAAIVSNPHEGIERWFEPGRELARRRDRRRRRSRPTASSSPIPAQAEEMGRRARERVLDEHTYAHRARRLLELVGLGRPGHGMTGASSPSCPPGTRRARSGGSSTEIRAFDPAFDVVVVDDGSTDETAAVAERRARPSYGCRSTSASAARCRPASSTRSTHGYDLAVRLDGDGQHDPRRAREAPRTRSSGRGATSSSARASWTRAAPTGRRSRAGSASGSSRGSSRCSAASA